jgi:hypothetical protein
MREDTTNDDARTPRNGIKWRRTTMPDMSNVVPLAGHERCKKKKKEANGRKG